MEKKDKSEKVEKSIVLEKIEKKGTIKCPARFIDSYGHVYNGNYMHLLMVILFRENLFEKIKHHLGINEKMEEEDTFPLEKYLLCETFIFKASIERDTNFDYELIVDIQQVKIKVKGSFLMNGKKVTTFDCSFGKKDIPQKPIKNDLKLVRKKKLLYESFEGYKSRVLGIVAYKGIFERQRAAWLSQKLGNKKNYYEFVEKHNIFFVSWLSKIHYYGEIGLGEQFIVYSYIKPQKGIQLRLCFYQELYNLKGNLIAKLSSEIIKVSVDSQSLQKTELIGPMSFWFVKHYRRIKQERINQKDYLLKSLSRWTKSGYKHSKLLFVPKKKKEPRKTQWDSLGLSHKRACIRPYLSLQSTQYLFAFLFYGYSFSYICYKCF